MIKLLLYKKKGNALSLGTGAGVAERDLLNNGWNVTCVDREQYSDTVIRESLNSKHMLKYEFIHDDINTIK